MNIIVKVIISLAVAAVATFAAGKLPAGATTLFAIIACATLATALLVSLGGAAASTSPAKPAGKPAPASKAAKAGSSSATGDASREQGKVKWFNVSKGFGFITREDGEEIFVHFRSIRGEGRRGLRDGQRVSFTVAQSDKGPQAEDVEGLE